MRLKHNCTFRVLIRAPIQLLSSPHWGRGSEACCNGVCLNTGEINASSLSRCFFPAGGTAAASVTTAASSSASSLFASYHPSFMLAFFSLSRCLMFCSRAQTCITFPWIITRQVLGKAGGIMMYYKLSHEGKRWGGVVLKFFLHLKPVDIAW